MQVLIQFVSTLVVGFLVAYIVRFVLNKVINKAIKLGKGAAGKVNLFGLQLPIGRARVIPKLVFAVMMFNTVLGALGVLGWDPTVIYIGLTGAVLDQVFNDGRAVAKLLK